MAFLIIFLGILCIATPIIKAYLDGYGPSSDADLVQWLMSMPFQHMILMRLMGQSGIGMLFFGTILFYFERL